MRSIRSRVAALAVFAALAGGVSDAAAQTPAPAGNPVNQLLKAGEAVFGYFPRNPDPDQAASLAGNREIDFIMISQENALDVPAIEAYTTAMREASARAGAAPIPVLVRIPAVDDAAATGDRVRQVVAAGAAGVVFPHVARAQQAEISVEVMKGQDLAHFLIVEEQEGIANVRDIVDTPELSVVFAGPGTLRQSYMGDMDAVERAIQSVLAQCKASDVACGITAGTEDIGKRLEEGFRVIIVYDPAALAVGRRAAGRSN